ncbi:hypothetical protein RND71_020449 [Anisodus tanguticus]|uniref:Uncharacterized protein n=1 Tax=Anisodus tanguticus TaxID=243964 RepID=A0AAE1S1I9_9SOLA|nr:hypothetical protein RND71_020449 [Anisodus tanguticus]
MSNAIMHAETTSDIFLRVKVNMDWLSCQQYWTNFSATTKLGVIHSGHLQQQGRSLMAPQYLPQDFHPYSEISNSNFENEKNYVGSVASKMALQHAI